MVPTRTIPVPSFNCIDSRESFSSSKDILSRSTANLTFCFVLVYCLEYIIRTYRTVLMGTVRDEYAHEDWYSDRTFYR